ncbi:DUF3040 domain-containing protein [Pseudonocardia lacus]|uniref:DUF3040 domain-containing protein n=1 Tax=Pseudonocardia lacus TaxID=2835865 RepID=UPI001BDD41D2|nr:DUF3040 domain-containing protein [Pseudonocardia lacus]
MSLSPHEMKVLAELEKDLRDGDPVLAEAFAQAPSSPLPVFPPRIPIGGVLLLIGALSGLAALSTFFADQLGVVGLAVLSGAAVVPWLVITARSTQRRSRATANEDDPRGSGAPGTGAPSPTRRRVLVAGASVVVALVLMPPAWSTAALVVLSIAAVAWLPRLVVRAVEKVERSDDSPRPGAPA